MNYLHLCYKRGKEFEVPKRVFDRASIDYIDKCTYILFINLYIYSLFLFIYLHSVGKEIVNRQFIKMAQDLFCPKRFTYFLPQVTVV